MLTESPVGLPVMLQATDLVKRYRQRSSPGQTVTAVDHVSLRLEAGRCLALVGESGSGKSTLARLLGRMERPSSGEVLIAGRSSSRRLRRADRQVVQMVFQDPFASLNPIHSIGYNISRALRLHHRCPSEAVPTTTAQLLEQVNLSPGSEFRHKLPHELSGGQRQRAAIAAALAVGPKVLLADEPVSMLDVSIRFDILGLLRQLAAEDDVALLYITHDIASAGHFADEVAVLYRGCVVEQGSADRIMSDPCHPYTQLLVAAAPKGGREAPRPLPQRQQHGPAPVTSGCPFAPRCPHVMAQCIDHRPPLIAKGADRTSACWLEA